jgi:hypothetical protein
MEWLRHAFACDPPGPAEPTEAQRPVVERLCREIVRRRLSAAALVALETARPLNSLAAQAIWVLSPLLTTFVTAEDQRRFAPFLERRGSIDFLCRRIEELESAAASGGEAAATAGRHAVEPAPSTGPSDGA